METTLHSTLSPAGKQRRRTAAKTGRKFPTKDAQKKTILPIPATISKKTRNHLLFRLFALGTMFFVLLSTFTAWRKREHRRSAPKDTAVPLKKIRFSLPYHAANRPNEKTEISQQHHKLAPSNDIVIQESTETLQKETETYHVEANSEYRADHASLSNTTKKPKPSVSDYKATETNDALKHQDRDDLPDSIEWYTRDDYKEGRRPMCRITRPIVLSNGTILVPDWMRGNEKLLRRCGLGLYGFYSMKLGPLGIQSTVDVDADFALTIHLERFQEPTHVPSVFLTEHVLKSSYLFDTFSGKARPANGVVEKHCLATESDTKCELPRHEKNNLIPAIFVPRRIENGEESSWPRMFVNMLGVAHGNGSGVVHLNASSILIKRHGKLHEKLLGTRFRSIMTTDGMFRHLPAGALEYSSFYSSKNGITRRWREKKTGEKCSLRIGIAASHDSSSGFDASRELKEKLEMLSKFVIPDSEIEVKEVEASAVTDFEGHIKQMQGLDIFIAGTGDDMTSIGFLPPSGLVFELMPFGVSPDTHRSLARALNLSYNLIRGKPQDESFKQCIDGEIFNLRKKGKLLFTETPEWKRPLLKAWEGAVGQFVMSGASSFDLLAEKEPVKNYYSKHCGLKQKIELAMDEAARKIITSVKEQCTKS